MTVFKTPITYLNDAPVNNRDRDSHALHLAPWQPIPRDVDGQSPSFWYSRDLQRAFNRIPPGSLRIAAGSQTLLSVNMWSPRPGSRWPFLISIASRRDSESSVNTSISILLSIAPLVLKAPLIRQRSSLSSMLSNKPTIDTTYTARQSNQSRWSLRFVHWWSKYDEILSWFLNGSLIELAEEQWDHRRSIDSASTSSIDVGMESISHSAFKRARSSKVSHNKQNWRSKISPVNSDRLIVDAGTVLRSANASRDSFCDRRNDRRCRAKSDWISGLIKKFTTSPWIIWCPKALLLNHFGYDNVSI